MSGRTGILIAIGAGALALFVGHALRVFADGAPTQQPLFYSGTLEQDGAPAAGEFTITLTLHDAETGGDDLCEVSSAATVEGGRFRIDASACAAALRAEPDAWAGVSFQGEDGVERAIEGRTKIGAVPYALEADHAMTASGANGALASALQSLTERVDALEDRTEKSSGFSALQSDPLTITPPNPEPVTVPFDNELYDFDDEYNPSSGVFKTKEGGYYEFTCMIAWNPSTSITDTWEVGIRLNEYERLYNGWISDGRAATREIHAVLKLNPGEEVRCTALQGSSTPTPLNHDSPYNQFAGRRFAPLP
jgi:C1q domain